MPFQPMDPGDIRRILSGETDVITPEVELEVEVFKRARCPVCSNVGASKVLLPPKIVADSNGDPLVVRSAFSPAHPLPQGYAKCPVCSSVFDPRTGLIVEQREPVLTDAEL